MIDKWYEGLNPNLNYFYLIVPYSNEYFVYYTMPKHNDWANKGKIETYRHRITKNFSLSKVLVQLRSEQSTMVNSKVRFWDKIFVERSC
jgi:hypothetical protein